MDNGMGFYEDLIEGVNKAIQQRFDKKPYRLAKAAGTTATHVERVVSGERKKFLQSVCRIFEAAGLKVVGNEIPIEEYAFIPRALAKPAAGGGSLETSGETEGCLAFRREWLGRKTRTSPERLRVMVVTGVSMQPTIDDGDIVLVDESDVAKKLHENSVYVIRKEDDIYIKRYKKGIGELLFMGDNREASYHDVKVRPGDEDGFSVIGRALWAGKEL